jgi:hypothetical protein
MSVPLSKTDIVPQIEEGKMSVPLSKTDIVPQIEEGKMSVPPSKTDRVPPKDNPPAPHPPSTAPKDTQAKGFSSYRQLFVIYIETSDICVRVFALIILKIFVYIMSFIINYNVIYVGYNMVS